MNLFTDLIWQVPLGLMSILAQYAFISALISNRLKAKGTERDRLLALAASGDQAAIQLFLKKAKDPVVCSLSFIKGKGLTARLKERDVSEDILSFISHASPVIGFLGTLLGMVGTFKALGVEVNMDVFFAGIGTAIKSSIWGCVVSLLSGLYAIIVESQKKKKEQAVTALLNSLNYEVSHAS